MILLQFKTGKELHLGVKTQPGVLDVTGALSDRSISQPHAGIPARLTEVYAGGSAAREPASRPTNRLYEPVVVFAPAFCPM